MFLTHGGETMLLLATTADAHWNGLEVVTEPCPELDQKDRIIGVLPVRLQFLIRPLRGRRGD